MRRRQKKRLVCFAASVVSILCAGMLIGTVYAQNQKEEIQAVQQMKEELELGIPDGRKEELAEETIIHIEEKDAEMEEAEENLPDDWNLILVNQTHLVPEDYQVELKEIGDGHQIDARAYEDFCAMIKAARADGVTVYVTSSFREMDKQTELHEKKIENLVLEGYSYTEAKELAAQVVAVPGTSEHQLGLALDFVSAEYKKLDEKQEQTTGFRWLKEHCQEYGFILRYPNGKTDITGIIYEPWHFRYVGREAAEVIMEAGITLEEYLGAKPVNAEKKKGYEQEKSEELTIDILKIGKADCSIITNGGHTLLIDCGEVDDSKEILKALEEKKIQKVDYLIISHYDKDHIGGAAEIIRNCRIGKVIEPDYIPDDPEAEAYLAYREAVSAAQVPQISVSDQLKVDMGDISLSIFGAGNHIYTKNIDNNHSLVVKMEHQGNRFLFAGDIEKQRISDMLAEGIETCDFLKVPHHGIYQDALVEFFMEVNMDYAVITCSGKNPAEPETLKALQETGCEAFLTEHGDVHIISRDTGIEIMQGLQ